MNHITKHTIKQIIEYISLLDMKSSLINEHAQEIKSNYEILKEKNLANEFYHDIKNSFDLQNEKDFELYVLFLSIIYKITLDGDSVTEALESLCDCNADIFIKLAIRTQLEAEIFRNSTISRNYPLRRKLHKLLVDEMDEIINLDMPYQHLHNRNENRIVVVTNQLLSDLHAPTNITKEICYTLQKNLGIEIILIVAVESIEYDEMEQIWIEPFIPNYLEEYNGNFITKRYDENIAGYQIIINKNNVSEMRQLIKEIYNFNPLCVWYLGNLTVFPDLFKKYTTVVGMPFTDGYSISDAQIMINYLDSKSPEVREMELYMKCHNQATIYYDLPMPVQPTNLKYSRLDYGIDDNNFVIAIIGNRLDSEVTEKFLELLIKVLSIDLRIIIVFIGNFNNYDFIIEEEIFKERTKYLGYQNDLVGLLSIVDLYVNPPRSGGGASAIYALYNGVPVVTLDSCDVATCVSRNDICLNDIEMLEMIEKYFCDSDFYNKQSEIAKLSLTKRSHENLAAETRNLLKKIKELII